MSRPNIFNANIANEIAKGMGQLVLPATLIKVSQEQDPDDSTKVVETTVSYSCRGFTEIKEVKSRTNSLVRETKRIVSILGGTLPDGIEPVSGDQITIEGITSLIDGNGVERDPAGAVYECRTT